MHRPVLKQARRATTYCSEHRKIALKETERETKSSASCYGLQNVNIMAIK